MPRGGRRPRARARRRAGCRRRGIRRWKSSARHGRRCTAPADEVASPRCAGADSAPQPSGRHARAHRGSRRTVSARLDRLRKAASALATSTASASSLAGGGARTRGGSRREIGIAAHGGGHLREVAAHFARIDHRPQALRPQVVRAPSQPYQRCRRRWPSSACCGRRGQAPSFRQAIGEAALRLMAGSRSTASVPDNRGSRKSRAPRRSRLVAGNAIGGILLRGGGHGPCERMRRNSASENGRVRRAARAQRAPADERERAKTRARSLERSVPVSRSTRPPVSTSNVTSQRPGMWNIRPSARYSPRAAR